MEFWREGIAGKATRCIGGDVDDDLHTTIVD
jgi:hypothetical protein